MPESPRDRYEREMRERREAYVAEREAIAEDPPEALLRRERVRPKGAAAGAADLSEDKLVRPRLLSQKERERLLPPGFRGINIVNGERATGPLPEPGGLPPATRTS